MLIDLPEEIETRLEALAKSAGRDKASVAQEAIISYLENIEDLQVAEQRLNELKSGQVRPIPLEAMIAKYAWQIEFLPSVDKDLANIGHDPTRRILRFLQERVANLEDPRSIGEALKGSRLGDLGDTESETIE